MPMCPEETGSGNGQNGAGVSRRKVELAYNSYMMGHFMGMNECGSSVTDFEDEVDGNSEPDLPSSDEETYSVFNYSDEDEDDDDDDDDDDDEDEDDDEDDDDAPPVYRCPLCDFDVHGSELRSRLEEVCPMCDGEFGEDIKVKPLSTSRKRTWSSEKSRIWADNSEFFGRKHASWGTGSIRDPMADSLLSQFIRNMSIEDSINNASDISNAKSLWTVAPDVGNEKDPEEGKRRASFFQEMVFSTML